MLSNCIALPHHLFEPVQKIGKEHGIDTKANVKVSIPVKPGDNWLGLILEINVSGKNNTKTFVAKSIIAKVAPTDPVYREFAEINAIYGLEIYVYNVVLPQLIKLQEEKKIELFAPFAECYRTIFVEPHETILLENLTNLGFQSPNYRLPIDFQHASLIMQSLGKFHALSFALRKDKPQVFRTFLGDIKECFFIRTFSEVVKKIGDQILDHLKENNGLFETFQKFLRDPSYVINTISTPERSAQYSVICHGDPQLRNCMFKYDSFSKQPIELRLLDWQLTRIGSPVLDIAFFVWTSTDKAFRDRHYEELIEIYYRNFSSFLKELGGDPETSFPREVLQEHLKQFSVFGIYMGIPMLSTNLTDVENTADVKTVEDTKSIVDGFVASVTPHYFERIKEVLVDFVAYGYDFGLC